MGEDGCILFKYDLMVTLIAIKARLVVKRYTQIYSSLDFVSSWQKMHFYMVTLMKRSTWSNLSDLLLEGSHLIWYVAYVGPYMASNNHPVHGFESFQTVIL